MSEIVIDLDTISRLGEDRSDENFEFRQFLKWKLRWSDEKLDALVHQIAAKVAGQVDCTVCANCCKTMGVTMSDAEIERLSDRLGISVQDFEDRYIVASSNEKLVEQMPCPFLDDCKCSVYEDRPGDCRGFPNLHKEDFRSRTLAVFENYGTCPIVFNTIERLKERFDFSSRRRGRR